MAPTGPELGLPSDAGPTTAVVLAGGTGTRLGHQRPKQLLRLGRWTILEHTVAMLNSCLDVDDVIVMMAHGHVDAARAELGSRYPKLRGVYEGGSTRNETTRRVLDVLGAADRKVLLHDAVRPFVDERIVRECVRALDAYRAVDVAIPSADTIIEVDDDDRITDIPDRSMLRRGQTPQAFWLSVLRQAYALAAGDAAFTATDDCGVIHKYLPDEPIVVVAGSESNMKVTHPPDLVIAEAFLRAERASGTQATRSIGGLRAVVDGPLRYREALRRELTRRDVQVVTSGPADVVVLAAARDAAMVDVLGDLEAAKGALATADDPRLILVLLPAADDPGGHAVVESGVAALALSWAEGTTESSWPGAVACVVSVPPGPDEADDAVVAGVMEAAMARTPPAVVRASNLAGGADGVE